MANTGPNSNQSQFFFTLDKTQELNKKNTIFGKVVGDTLYNIVAMGELEVDDHERPLNPPKITRIEIISNPFDDVIPRTTAKERQAAALASMRQENKGQEQRISHSVKTSKQKKYGLVPHLHT